MEQLIPPAPKRIPTPKISYPLKLPSIGHPNRIQTQPQIPITHPKKKVSLRPVECITTLWEILCLRKRHPIGIPQGLKRNNSFLTELFVDSLHGEASYHARHKHDQRNDGDVCCVYLQSDCQVQRDVGLTEVDKEPCGHVDTWNHKLEYSRDRSSETVRDTANCFT